MENVIIKLIENDKSEREVVPASFRFVRERYTPYTQCSGVLIGSYSIADVYSIELYYKGQILHKGMADSIQRRYLNGRHIITFLSRGFTMLLGQNEPVPGIISDVTLGSLISGNTTIPHVTCETVSKKVNYIYVKEKSTIWDAVCAYAYKAYTNYPYIAGTNTVQVSIPTSSKKFRYSNLDIVSAGESLCLSGIISKAYMSDLNGDYIYSAENSDACSEEIIREKYYPLDRQWYSSPSEGLQSKLNYSNRKQYFVWVKYKGHLFENLLDRASYSGEGVEMRSERISAIEFAGNKNGVFTTISVYQDSYS